MRTTLVICFVFATRFHAGLLSADNANETLSSLSFDEAAELAKMKATCMSNSDFEELTGNAIFVARFFASDLARTAILTIGLTELRATLNFAPLGPWKHYNRTKPSEEELASTPTIEAYYDLKEFRDKKRSLDSFMLLEKNMPPAIAYFDKRFPWIRTNFRRKFIEIRRSEPMIGRKTIDRMVDVLITMWNRVDHAADRMLSGNEYIDNECFKY